MDKKIIENRKKFDIDLQDKFNKIQSKLEYFIRSNFVLLQNSKDYDITESELFGLSLFGSDIIKDFNLLSQEKFTKKQGA